MLLGREQGHISALCPSRCWEQRPVGPSGALLPSLPLPTLPSLILVFFCFFPGDFFSLHLFCPRWVWRGAGRGKKGCGAPASPGWQRGRAGAAAASSAPRPCEHPRAAPAAKAHPPSLRGSPVPHPHLGARAVVAQGHRAVPRRWLGARWPTAAPGRISRVKPLMQPLRGRLLSVSGSL